MPVLKDNWIYMIWFQIIDPYLTNPSRNFYEGFSCAVRYDKSQEIAGILGNNLYKVGYRGVDKLEDAVGVFDQLLVIKSIENPGEQTDKFPWELDEDKTRIF